MNPRPKFADFPAEVEIYGQTQSTFPLPQNGPCSSIWACCIAKPSKYRQFEVKHLQFFHPDTFIKTLLLHLISITPEENARLENSMQRPVVPHEDFPHFPITQKLPEGAQEKQEKPAGQPALFFSSTIKRGNGKSRMSSVATTAAVLQGVLGAMPAVRLMRWSGALQRPWGQ